MARTPLQDGYGDNVDTMAGWPWVGHRDNAVGVSIKHGMFQQMASTHHPILTLTMTKKSTKKSDKPPSLSGSSMHLSISHGIASIATTVKKHVKTLACMPFQEG
jgi:hypothetical protein